MERMARVSSSSGGGKQDAESAKDDVPKSARGTGR